MKSKCMQLVMSIIFFAGGQALVAAPTNIILKNASAFDFVYKPRHSSLHLYKYGSAEPHGYEENLVRAGEGKHVRIGARRPIEFSIKRYGYGSALSPWFDMPDPEELAKEQLNAEQYKKYEAAINSGKMPIVVVKSSYMGGWSFSIGYTN